MDTHRYDYIAILSIKRQTNLILKSNTYKQMKNHLFTTRH